MKKIIGYTMMAVPFIGYFVLLGISYGFLNLIFILGILVLLVLWIAISVKLTID